MVTAERAETQQTTTVPRRWLLTVQVRNLLARTTVISQNTLEKFDKGLRNQWIQTIGVYGLDRRNRCRVGLELTIDWHTYSLQVVLFCHLLYKVEKSRTGFGTYSKPKEKVGKRGS
jgi:hypothetical protein